MARPLRARRAALGLAVACASLAAVFGPGSVGAQPAPGAPPAASTPAPRDPAVDATRARARAILREPAYGFCRDARRFVRPSELHYCGLVHERSACPEFDQACRRLERKPPGCLAPRNIGVANRVGQIVSLVVLVSVVLALLVLMVRGWLRARRVEELADAEPDADARPSMVPIPAAGSAELLARALEAHGRGDHTAALYALYGALLRKLDERGVIRIDPAFTNGDYVRQCAPGELRGPLREAVREVERVRFGGAAATPDAFTRLLARVEPLVRAVGAVLLAVLLGGALVACDRLPSAREGFSGSTDTGAGGHRAVRALLEAEGIPARRLIESPEDLEEPERVVVVDTRAAELDQEQWTSVLAWVDRGGALVVAGGPLPRELGIELERGGARSGVMLAPAYGTPVVVQVDPGAPALRRPVAGFVVASYTRDDAPYAALVQRGRGRVLVLASNELVVNAGLAVDDNPAATVALMRQFAAGRTVYFVEESGGAAGNPLRSLARAGLLPAVLQGLLALALFYLMVGRHFATPRDRTEVSRRAFAEHVRAVGGLYARARASGPVLRAYAQLVTERVRERTGAARAGASGGVVDAVAARTGAPREEVEQVFRAVEQAGAGERGSGSAEEQLRLVKRLNEWLRQLG